MWASLDLREREQEIKKRTVARKSSHPKESESKSRKSLSHSQKQQQKKSEPSPKVKARNGIQ